MSDELMPCPFCGCKARLALGEHAFDGAEVMCSECGCQGGHHENDAMGAEAAAAWNTRTDAISNAAYVAGLEAALSSIAKEKFYPMGIGIEPEYTREAKLAQAALASRPASPDVRVVTVEQLERWHDTFGAYHCYRSAAEIRAIIAGQP